MRRVHLTRAEAEGFYAVHRERPFFPSLTAFMSSGPVVVMVLEADGAIRKWRDLMGATDPSKAAPGTLRAEFGTSIERNATHGSDAPETAAFEIGYFFAGVDLDLTPAAGTRPWRSASSWWSSASSSRRRAAAVVGCADRPAARRHRRTARLVLVLPADHDVHPRERRADAADGAVQAVRHAQGTHDSSHPRNPRHPAGRGRALAARRGRLAPALRALRLRRGAHADHRARGAVREGHRRDHRHRAEGDVRLHRQGRRAHHAPARGDAEPGAGLRRAQPRAVDGRRRRSTCSGRCSGTSGRRRAATASSTSSTSRCSAWPTRRSTPRCSISRGRW